MSDPKKPMSKSEARRLIKAGAVKLNGVKITDPYKPLDYKDGDVLQIGKRRFYRLRVEQP